jgi:hypothetical protein
MARFRNVSPLGDLDVPALGLTIPAGDIVDVKDPEISASFADQAGTWEPVLSPAERKAADKADDVAATEPAPTA